MPSRPFTDEKTRGEHATLARSMSKTSKVLALVVVSIVAMCTWKSSSSIWNVLRRIEDMYLGDVTDLCPQQRAVVPVKNEAIQRKLADLYTTPSFKNMSVSWLAGAVQIPCVCYKVIEFIMTGKAFMLIPKN